MQLTTRSRRFLARAVLLGEWQGRKRLHFVKFLQLQQKQRWHFRGVFLGRVPAHHRPIHTVALLFYRQTLP